MFELLHEPVTDPFLRQNLTAVIENRTNYARIPFLGKVMSVNSQYLIFTNKQFFPVQFSLFDCALSKCLKSFKFSSKNIILTKKILWRDLSTPQQLQV